MEGYQGMAGEDAAIDAVCALIAEHGTLHYRLGGADGRVVAFTSPDAGGASCRIDLPVGAFWAAVAPRDLGPRLGWHESAGAGAAASAAFTYALARPAGGRIVVEDRAWRVPGQGRRPAETHGILHSVRTEGMPGEEDDPGLLAVACALEGGRFEIAFQPVVGADSGQIGFHECLARLEGPDGRLHDAGSFIPRLAAAGLIGHLDRQVLLRAFATLAANPATRLSINIHPSTVGDAEWLTLFDAAAADHPDTADRLIVEITEQGAMQDVEATRRFIAHLRAAGAALALDDFGEGQTSFSQLRDFRFDIVKIAGSFVQGVVEDPDARFFAETLVGVARHFEMMTVAEYVQSAAAARILAGLGVDCFQGFYFGRPSLVLEPSEELRDKAAGS